MFHDLERSNYLSLKDRVKIQGALFLLIDNSKMKVRYQHFFFK